MTIHKAIDTLEKKLKDSEILKDAETAEAWELMKRLGDYMEQQGAA